MLYWSRDPQKQKQMQFYIERCCSIDKCDDFKAVYSFLL